MSLDSLTSEEVDILEEALHALTCAEAHFKLRDRSNAALHLASRIRYSPITNLTTGAASQLTTLLGQLETREASESTEGHPGEILLEFTT